MILHKMIRSSQISTVYLTSRARRHSAFQINPRQHTHLLVITVGKLHRVRHLIDGTATVRPALLLVLLLGKILAARHDEVLVRFEAVRADGTGFREEGVVFEAVVEEFHFFGFDALEAACGCSMVIGFGG